MNITLTNTAYSSTAIILQPRGALKWVALLWFSITGSRRHLVVQSSAFVKVIQVTKALDGHKQFKHSKNSVCGMVPRVFINRGS